MIRNSKCGMILKHQFRYHSDSEWVDYFQCVKFSIDSILPFSAFTLNQNNRIQFWSFQLYDDWHFVLFEHLSFPNASLLHSNIIRVLWWLIEMNINQNTANDSSFRLESVHFPLLSCFIQPITHILDINPSFMILIYQTSFYYILI